MWQRVVTILVIFIWLVPVSATKLIVNPPKPVVSMGQRLTLSVSGAIGEVTWGKPMKGGQILGTGTSVQCH